MLVFDNPVISFSSGKRMKMTSAEPFKLAPSL
jgi:hypothetical protein